MGLETGTYISDLVDTNPPNSDPESQGAAHLRLIKDVLQNTFPGASKAFPFATTVAKTASYTVLSTDENKTFLVDTAAGAVTLTLPILAAADAGWQCHLIKTNTGTNPAFWAPPSGTIQSGAISGLTKTRRCIPGVRTTAIWTGTAWIATRAIQVPVGCTLDYHPSDTLPTGFEWPSAQTLASASTNYPDYNAIKGSGLTPDLRGRATFGRDDMGGSAQSRITNAGCGIVGTTLGAAGGAQNKAIARTNFPNLSFTVSGITLNDPGHSHVYVASGTGTSSSNTPGNNFLGNNVTIYNSSGSTAMNASVITANNTGITISSQGSAASGGSDTALVTISPAIIANKLLVVE